MDVKLSNSDKVSIIDDADAHLLNRQNTFYLATDGYVSTTEQGHPVALHRLVMGLAYRDGNIVDHINGDKLDNRRCNLRCVTNAENIRRRGKVHKNTKSKYKGVTWNKSANKWHAQMRHSYRTIYLGLHATEEAAARAYDKKAKELFGEFANLNFNS